SERGLRDRVKFHTQLSSEWRTTARASGRRSRDAPLAYARCAVDCIGSANVSETVEAAVANLFGQSAPSTIFTLPARKTFGEKLLIRLVRRVFRGGIRSRIKKRRSFPQRWTFAQGVNDKEVIHNG